MGQVDEARAAGYSEDEIKAYLAPKVAEAQAAGYSEKEISNHLGIRPVDHGAAQKSLGGRVYDNIATTAKNAASAVIGIGETSASLLSGFGAGFPAYLVGGIGGLIARNTYSPDTDPKVLATMFAEAVTYSPRSDSGKAMTDTATYPFQLLAEFKEKQGRAVADKTGSAALAAITDETIGLLPFVLFGGLMRSLKGKTPENSDFHVAAQEMTAERPRDAPVAEPVAEGAAPKAEPVVELAPAVDRAAAAKTVADKLQDVYEKTGVDPETLKTAAAKDPTILEDIASSNMETPRAVGGGKAPPPEEPPARAPATPPEEPPAGSPAAAQAAVLARVSVGEQHFKEFTWEKFYTAVKDDLYPIAAIEKELAGGKLLDVAESPYKLARETRGAAGKATQFLDYGTFDFNTYKTTGPGLKQIVKPHEKDLEGFRAYAVARRAEELHARGIETGVPAAEARQVVAGGAKYEAAFQQLQEYQNAVTKYLKDSGVLSEEGYAAMLEANKDYVPFFRSFDEPSTQKAGAGMRVHNPIRAIKGSERLIVDPIESIIKNTYLYTALAERNAVGRAFGDLTLRDKQAAADLGITVVKQKMRPIQLEEREIRKLFDEFVTVKTRTSRQQSESTKTTGSAAQGAEPANKVFEMNKARVADALTSRGFSPNEAEIMMRRLGNKDAKGGDTIIEKMVQEVVNTERIVELDVRLPSDAATVFRPDAMRPAPNQIRYFENGKPVTLEVPIELADAFKATDRESSGLLLKMIAFPARTLRAGAILSPDFIARNPLRDQYEAFVNSKNGYVPFYDLVRGAMSIAKKDGDFQSWLKSGGANSAIVSLDREYLQQHLKTLNENTGLMKRSWNVVSSPIEVLRITSELMENATRLGEFKRAKATTKAEIQAAGFESREVTLDFQRIGAQTRGLNMISAFMNAQMEGMDRSVRAVKDRPLGTTARLAAAVTAPSILLWYANNSTPERQARWREVPNWQRDLFWIVMTDEHTYRVPKPHAYGIIFGSSAERMLDQFAADKPDAMKDFMTTLGGMAATNVMPTGAVPLLEHMTNYSFFRDNPLIPSRMEGILPEYQYQEYTTQTSRALGQLVGAFPGLKDKSIASPIVIDNYIRGWTGGLGSYARDLLDFDLRMHGILPDPPQPLGTLADVPVVRAFVVRYPSATAQSVQDFYDKHAERKKVYDTFQYLVKNGDPEAAEKELLLDPTAFVRLDGIQESLRELNANIRMVHRAPDMSPSDKRQLIDTMYGMMIEMSRSGNEAMRDIDAALKPTE